MAKTQPSFSDPEVFPDNKIVNSGINQTKAIIESNTTNTLADSSICISPISCV
jgi:hypothetical protein